jgi:transposase
MWVKHIERRLPMRREYRQEQALARGKDVFIGIDVHKEKWHVTARSAGEEVFHGSMLSEYQSLKKFLERFKGCKVKVAYEAGPCGFGLYDRLSGDGIETVVAPPSLIPVESGNKVKTDKRDSRKLAKLLESNMLKKGYVLSEEDRANRELLRTRRQLMEHRSDVMRQIKSKLLFHGIKSPFPQRQSWTRRYVRWLKELHFEHEVVRVSFNTLLDLYEYLGSQVMRISKEVIALSQSDKYGEKIKLLRSVPGIGLLIGMELLVELADIERFKTADEIASFMGLTPSEYSTGQYVRQGRITRCGNTRARVCLVESSWHLIMKDPCLRAKYMKLKYRRGAKRAIIAIARNLIIRIRRILLNNEPYVIAVTAP